jgi:CheY-like chemotaxis protein
VLLVEDDRDVQRLMQQLLQKQHVAADMADNGQVACERARSALSEGRPYDLILMDVQMPVMDGLDATRRLRSEGWTGPIVALTAHAMPGDRGKCQAAGCDDYVPKPISRTTLQTVLQRYVRPACVAGPSSIEGSPESDDPCGSLDPELQSLDRVARLVDAYAQELPASVGVMAEV